MGNPLLSIGIIFRDDIRCIERCLKALSPLREALPCELVMADTGSQDGSRQIAEKYADILFDFPWIDDFSAARNAVIQRSSGVWHLVVDTDEYLDEDISELVGFLKPKRMTKRADYCSVIIRNYDTYEMDHSYTDFMGIRLARRASGAHYVGAIHERWDQKEDETLHINSLSRTIFHHDGYVNLGGKKLERNLALIRKKLEEDPDELMAHLQYIESGGGEPDFLEQLHLAVSMVAEKKPTWKWIGPPILRHAVIQASNRKLPELEEWIQMAEELFPDSMYTRIDVEYTAFLHCWSQKDYAACIQRGERFLKAMKDYRSGKADSSARLYSVIQLASPYWEQDLRTVLSSAYLEENQFQQARAVLEGIKEYRLLSATQISNFLLALKGLHRKSELDTAPLLKAFWAGISEPKPNQTRADERIKAFFQYGRLLFLPDERKLDEDFSDVFRPGYTLFLPLEGDCALGTAAAIWAEEDPRILTDKLSGVDWERTPIHILAHALERGAEFPPADHPLSLEEMDGLSARLVKDNPERMPTLIERAAEFGRMENSRGAAWARGLVLASVRAFDWSADSPDEEQGMDLARRFAQVEEQFLPLCYAPAALEEENLFLLPPLHRFGWYCSRAFAALERGEAAQYVHLLRTGLETCKNMKPMVEFLAGHTQQLQALLTPPELRSLADQVRMILARYEPGDPAVAALKSSPAYQQVAHLIEGRSAPVWGELLQ